MSAPIPKCLPGPAHRPRLTRPHHNPMEIGLVSSISQMEKLTCPCCEEQIPTQDRLAAQPEPKPSNQQTEGHLAFQISDLYSRPSMD